MYPDYCDIPPIGASWQSNAAAFVVLLFFAYRIVWWATLANNMVNFLHIDPVLLLLSGCLLSVRLLALGKWGSNRPIDRTQFW